MGTFEYLLGQLGSMNLQDVLDILVVTFLIYQSIRLVRETRAMQLLKGLLALVAMYVVSYYGQLTTVNFIMRNILSIGVLALLIVFQPELRRMLEQVGRSRLTSFVIFPSGTEGEQGRFLWKRCVNAVTEGCASLSRQRRGALIVFERETLLGDVIDTGTIIDAEPSTELINNIFFPSSALHDGAVIVRRGRLYAAGCFLPLSANFEISKEFGTRHRAALGMSEVSDAVVIVVSEERGKITLVRNGRFTVDVTVEELGDVLRDAFVEPAEPSRRSMRVTFWRSSKNEED